MQTSIEQRVKVGVVGANGYSGEELVRIILGHPGMELVGITSRQETGRQLGDVFPRFRKLPGADIAFVAPEIHALLASGADCFFLALPHGVAAGFASPLREAGRRVIDISADFRLQDTAVYKEFYDHEHPAPDLLADAVYGLPEAHREKIRQAGLVAAPGCYPTSILLPLIPLLKANAIDTNSIRVASASGTSGAGRKADATLLFAECSGSMRAYGIPKHRHLSEIEQELGNAAGRALRIVFAPHLAPMVRGIHTTIFCEPKEGFEEDTLRNLLLTAYQNEPFVRVLDGLPDTKHVTGTNFCDIGLRFDERTGTLLLLSAEDNLVKGAGGQGVQCFNLMFGFPETLGLI
jgi:N-acetyl-gamma-glutamyl-phosphate reductase